MKKDIDYSNLFDCLQKDMELLNNKNDELKVWGFKLADAEEKYKVAQAIYMTEQTMNGTKATIMKDLATGQKDIAYLRKQRDKCNIMYETIKESIYSLKVQIRINETFLKLEYGGKQQ